MSPSEIAFLALGLVLGAAAGGAIAQALRGRPAPRREVRLTITPNAIPAGRTRTLAVAHGTPYPGVIPGSPDGAALEEAAMVVVARPPAAPSPGGTMPSQARTRVPSAAIVLPITAVGVPIAASAEPRVAQPQGPAPVAVAPSAPPVLIRPDGGGFTASARPVLEASGTAAVAVAVLAPAATPADRMTPSHGFATLVRPRPPVDAPRPAIPAAAVAVAGPPVAARPVEATRPELPQVRLAPPSGPTLTRPPAAAAAIAGQRPRAQAADAGVPGAGDPGVPGAAPADRPEASGQCAGQRRIVDERCALAGVARDQAKAAADSLHEARRAYDVVRDRVDGAAALADPRRVAGEKDRLHAAFRAASDRAAGPEETEAAARAWLDEINVLNAAVRDAIRTRDAGTSELQAALPALERLAAEADAARIAAENGEAGCHEAREDLARCEEAEVAARRATPPVPDEPHPFDKVWPSEAPDLVEPASLDLLSGVSAIVRVLRGEREARDRVVAELAGQDGESAREWQLRISRLVDAINGRAIEDGYLDLPTDDPFWRLFEQRESRDIVGALSALGFRYDGLGGFADERVPAARDLSLAVGYAGLDRMRIRTWPPESDLASLYARATVASDEWLVNQAGDLSLGRMVDALGGRAAELADLWNAWGRVRPALLAE